MALDLALCIVPKQIELLFEKAKSDPLYAETLGFLPDILQDEFEDFNDEERIRFKQDVLNLRQFHHFSEEDFFYDKFRCTSTLDYLLDQYLKSRKIEFESSLIWDGGDKISDKIVGVQGIPLRLFNRSQIEKANEFLTPLNFSDLRPFYDFEKMRHDGVYKLTSPEYLYVVEEALRAIKTIFNKANEDQNLLVFKRID